MQCRRTRIASLVGLVGLVALFETGCAAAVESSKSEDRARRTIPIPICLKSLPRHAASSVVSTLTPEDYWALILPSYDSEAGTVDPASPDCAERPLLSDPSLAEAVGVKSSLAVTPTELTIAKGPDGFQVVWLRSHRFADNTAGGPIALVRPKEAYAEAYAIGLYRGTPATAEFAYERLGPDILVTATENGCANPAPSQSCESPEIIYLAREGALKPAATFALDEIKYGTAPAVSGQVQYRLTSTAKFKAKSVIVSEQLVLKDSGQNEIRRATLDRTFTLGPDGKLVADVDSLWGQVAAKPPPEPPPPPPLPPKSHR
jgi:hypothetical protein